MAAAAVISSAVMQEERQRRMSAARRMSGAYAIPRGRRPSLASEGGQPAIISPPSNLSDMGPQDAPSNVATPSSAASGYYPVQGTAPSAVGGAAQPLPPCDSEASSTQSTPKARHTSALPHTATGAPRHSNSAEPGAERGPRLSDHSNPYTSRLASRDSDHVDRMASYQSGEFRSFDYGPSNAPADPGFEPSRMNATHSVRSMLDPNASARQLAYTQSRYRLRAAMKEFGGTLKEQAAVIIPPPVQLAPIGWFPAGENLGHKIYLILDEPSCSHLAKLASLIIFCAILVATGLFCAQSMPEYRIAVAKTGQDQPAFTIIEAICIAIFTSEYLARLCTIPWVPADEVLDSTDAMTSSRPPLQQPLFRKLWVFVSAPLNILDLLAFLPYFVELVVDAAIPGFAAIRVLRLARVFRVFKISKYSKGVQLVTRVLVASREALYLLVFFVCLAMIVFGSLVFYAEGGDYDPSTGKYMRADVTGSSLEESPFTSIPASFWWVIVTMTTVGYGDMYPTSGLGKFIGGLVMLCGILTLALPITVIGANFAVEYSIEEGAAEVAEQSQSSSAVSTQSKPPMMVQASPKAGTASVKVAPAPAPTTASTPPAGAIGVFEPTFGRSPGPTPQSAQTLPGPLTDEVQVLDAKHMPVSLAPEEIRQVFTKMGILMDENERLQRAVQGLINMLQQQQRDLVGAGRTRLDPL